MTRKSLSDILHEGNQQSLSRAWGETQAAEDLVPLPSAEYVARIVGGELFTSKTKGTAGYKLAFRVLEGDYQGRQFWHDIWLTPAALPMAKRDLAKLGVTQLEQLEHPLPPGIRCKVKLVLRKDDDGAEYNRVKRFEVIGIDPPEVDPFAPIDVPSPPTPLPKGEGNISPQDGPHPDPLSKDEGTDTTSDGTAGGGNDDF